MLPWEEPIFLLKQHFRVEPDPTFAWQGYLEQVTNNVASFGYKMEVTESTPLISLAFHKDEAVEKILQLHYAGKTKMLGKIRIKLEIDTNPPPGALIDVIHTDFPYLAPVTVQDLATLFAGKIHALLSRRYVKGRDWYDFIWYTSRRTPVNYQYLEEALHQSGPWKDTQVHVDRAWLQDALYQKITSIDWLEAGMDVRRFVPVDEQSSIDFWKAEVFIQQLDKM